MFRSARNIFIAVLSVFALLSIVRSMDAAICSAAKVEQSVVAALEGDDDGREIYLARRANALFSVPRTANTVSGSRTNFTPEYGSISTLSTHADERVSCVAFKSACRHFGTSRRIGRYILHRNIRL